MKHSLARLIVPLSLLLVLGLSACNNGQNLEQAAEETTSTESVTDKKEMSYPRIKQLEIPAPIASRIDSEREYHGKKLEDPYFWLKDQGYPEVNDEPVLDYLKAENAYHAAFLEPHTGLVDTIFEEFKGRTDETEESVPYIENGYEYRWFSREGEEYRTRSRKNLEKGFHGREKDFSSRQGSAGCWNAPRPPTATRGSRGMKPAMTPQFLSKPVVFPDSPKKPRRKPMFALQNHARVKLRSMFRPDGLV